MRATQEEIQKRRKAESLQETQATGLFLRFRVRVRVGVRVRV